jgi:hypothetical protein
VKALVFVSQRGNCVECKLGERTVMFCAEGLACVGSQAEHLSDTCTGESKSGSDRSASSQVSCRPGLQTGRSAWTLGSKQAKLADRFVFRQPAVHRLKAA